MATSIKIIKSSDDEDENIGLAGKEHLCSICAQRDARYTCPRCNISYCSLPCYQHKKHEVCSESFYKDCVMDEMKELSASRPEDRQKIFEMLAREHEQFGVDSDDDHNSSSLTERMEGLDLDRDSGEVWKRLTQQEREEFARMLKDGRLANLVTIWTPWWMSKLSSALVQESVTDSIPDGFPPHLTEIPDINQLLKSKPSVDIKYSVINVISAYSFVARLHNGDHHETPIESSEELLQVCGALRQGENYPGSREAIHAALQEIRKDGSGFTVPSSFPIVLVGDVLHIIRQTKLSPLCGVLSALSDAFSLLTEGSRELKKGGKRKKRNKAKSLHVSTKEGNDLDRQIFLAKKKLTFLLSWVQRYGMCLAHLCHELALELECLKDEAAETKSLQSAVERGLQAGKLQPKAASIEEVN